MPIFFVTSSTSYSTRTAVHRRTMLLWNSSQRTASQISKWSVLPTRTASFSRDAISRCFATRVIRPTASIFAGIALALSLVRSMTCIDRRDCNRPSSRTRRLAMPRTLRRCTRTESRFCIGNDHQLGVFGQALASLRRNKRPFASSYYGIRRIDPTRTSPSEFSTPEPMSDILSHFLPLRNKALPQCALFRAFSTHAHHPCMHMLSSKLHIG